MRPLLIDQHHPNNLHISSATKDTGAGTETDVTSNSQTISQKNNFRHRPIQRPSSRLSSASTTTDLRKRASVTGAPRPGAAGKSKPPHALPQSESVVINYSRKPAITLTPILAKNSTNNSTRTITTLRSDDKNDSNLSDTTSPRSPDRITLRSGAITPESITSPLPSKTRPPLKPQNQNATQMKKRPLEIGLSKIGAGRATPSPRTNMPPERSTAMNNNNSNRPQMPALSAAAARAANKTPLMPKLASKPLQPPTPTTTTTPTARRTQHPQTASSSSQSSQHEELLASMPPFLANITPRSGSRQNRVDSANSTPSGTPRLERFDGGEFKMGSVPVSPPPRPDYARRSGSSFSPLPHEPNGHGGREAQHESKFFHASDVHNARPPATTKQAQPKQPVFFYANGNTIENRPNNANAVHSIPAATQSQDNVSSKFMYANGAPEAPSGSLSVPLPRSPLPAASTAPKPSVGRLSVGSQASGTLLSPRPVSPTKGPSQPAQQSLMSSAIPPSAGIQRGQPSHLPGSVADKLRRTSSGTSRTRGHHSRSGSLVLADLGASASAPPSRLMSPQYPSGPSSPTHAPSTPTPLTLASIIQAAEELPDQDESVSADDSRSEVQSPTKSQTTDPINELVANARRERKVQDLQITNASLEAINRTLERQLRKQTSELRRFQRLSRTGLSLASTAASTRVASEAIFVEEVGLRLANLSEEESEAEEEALDEPDEESFSDTDEDLESLTPNQLAERDAKHRQRDEQRLKLDLTKHQQLLVDSQKINQSIRRCLDWTEELIKDGKKALAYNVKASDVELGGKVLSPLDEPEDQGERFQLHDELVDDIIKLGDLVTEEPERISSWSPGPQDRDSGIEMPVDGG